MTKVLEVSDKKLKIVFCSFLKQLRNATERLDQKDISLRAKIEEINRTLSIKVKSNWSNHPCKCKQLGPVVRRVDKTIQWMNYYPMNSVVCFINTYRYPLDSDLSGR